MLMPIWQMPLQWTARFKALHKSLKVFVFFAIHKEKRSISCSGSSWDTRRRNSGTKWKEKPCTFGGMGAKQMADERRFSQPGIYHIRVRGSLNSKWADWFPGFVMTARESGETLLSGSRIDQAALQGVLAKIHSLGLPLLMVAWTECPCSSKDCPRRGVCQECASHHTASGGLPFCFRAKTWWDKQCRSLTRVNL